MQYGRLLKMARTEGNEKCGIISCDMSFFGNDYIVKDVNLDDNLTDKSTEDSCTANLEQHTEAILESGAAAHILIHNHPDREEADPSKADGESLAFDESYFDEKQGLGKVLMGVVAENEITFWENTETGMTQVPIEIIDATTVDAEQPHDKKTQMNFTPNTNALGQKCDRTPLQQ